MDGGNYNDLKPLYFIIYMQTLEWIDEGALIWEMASEERIVMNNII